MPVPVPDLFVQSTVNLISKGLIKCQHQLVTQVCSLSVVLPANSFHSTFWVWLKETAKRFKDRKTGHFIHGAKSQSHIRDGSLFMGMTGSENQKEIFVFFLRPMWKSYQNFKARLNFYYKFFKARSKEILKLTLILWQLQYERHFCTHCIRTCAGLTNQLFSATDLQLNRILFSEAVLAQISFWKSRK